MVQHIFLKPVVIIDPCLGTTADMESRGHMGSGPFHDLAKLRPVIHVFIFQLLHRRSGDDQPVKMAIPEFLESIIKLHQVRGCNIDRAVHACPHKSDIELKRGIGKHSQELEFCLLFGRHKVVDADLERTDVLINGSFLVNDKQIFSLQYLLYRYVVLNPDGH